CGRAGGAAVVADEVGWWAGGGREPGPSKRRACVNARMTVITGFRLSRRRAKPGSLGRNDMHWWWGSRLLPNLSSAGSVLLPSQPCQDRAAHHPVLVLLRQEVQLLGEMRDPLPVGGFFEGVGEVGSPVAAAWAEGIEAA